MARGSLRHGQCSEPAERAEHNLRAEHGDRNFRCDELRRFELASGTGAARACVRRGLWTSLRRQQRPGDYLDYLSRERVHANRGRVLLSRSRHGCDCRKRGSFRSDSKETADTPTEQLTTTVVGSVRTLGADSSVHSLSCSFPRQASEFSGPPAPAVVYDGRATNAPRPRMIMPTPICRAPIVNPGDHALNVTV